MATVQDVANAAGVSVSTVSRVLNNSVLVTPEKREKVMQAIAEVGYEMSRTKAMKNVKARAVLVVTTILFEDLLRGIDEAADELGYTIIHEYIGVQQNAYARCQELLSVLRGSIAGVLLVNVVSKDENIPKLFSEYPVVQVGEFFSMDPTYVIATDDECAFHDMVSLLIRKGRKRIAYVGIGTSEVSHTELIINKKRRQGYRRALSENELPYLPEYTFSADYSIEGGMDAAEYLLGLNPPPDAVCCAVDQIAVGCVKKLRQRGIDVPGQIAVTGCDDHLIAQACIPSITTIAQSFEEIGAEAIQVLDRIVQGQLTRGCKVLIQHEIIEREST